MTTTLNAVSGTGLVQTSDGSGILKVQSNSVTTNALAWVNFNGVTTATIRASYNVSSVTRNSTGLYTISFTNNLSDANYSIVGSGFWYSGASTNAAWIIAEVTSNQTTRSATTSSVQVTTVNSNFAVTDCGSTNVAIFGN